MKLTVVLPAYNEAKDLPPLLNRLQSVLSKTPHDFKILVVDDGSTDNTVNIVNDFSEKLGTVELVQHEANKGLGQAIQTGLSAAASEPGVVITMDADNSHDPAVIPAMLDRIQEGDDVVIASRFVSGGKMIGVAAHRRFLSFAAGFVMKRVFPHSQVRDYSAGYRAYRTSIIRSLQDYFGSSFVQENGFACMLEILLKMRHINAQISEVPLVLRYDLKWGPSKMRIFRTLMRYGVVMSRALMLTFRVWLRQLYPAKQLASLK